MSTPLQDRSGSESPLSELSGTPSPPNSPSYNTSPDTIRIKAPTSIKAVATSASAKSKITAGASSRNVVSASKPAAGRGRTTSASITKFSSVSKVTTSKRVPSPVRTVVSDWESNSSDEDEEDIQFPGIPVTSSVTKSTTTTSTIATSSSPTGHLFSKLGAGKDAPRCPLGTALDFQVGRMTNGLVPTPLYSPVAANTKAQTSPTLKLAPGAFATIGKAPTVAAEKIVNKKRDHDTLENTDVSVVGEQDKVVDEEEPKAKRQRKQSKKAMEASQSDEDFVEKPKPTPAKRVIKNNDGKVVSPPRVTIRFTSSGSSSPVAISKAKDDSSKKGAVVSTPEKKRPGRPRKHPLPEKVDTAMQVDQPAAVTTTVSKPINKPISKPVNKPTPGARKRKFDLEIDMNDAGTLLADKSQVDASTTVNDPANNPSSSPADATSSPPPAKKVRTQAPAKSTTPPKVPKGLIEASRKSQRAPKLSPKAREALGENVPKEDDSAELVWGFQEKGVWTEPKVLSRADHEREKEERELQKRNSKDTGYPNKTRKHTIKWWKDHHGAELPEPDYGRAEEEAMEEQPGADRFSLKDLKSDEEELGEMEKFYENEMKVEHHHPKAVDNAGPSYRWHSEDLHHAQAPESDCRGSMPEPKWKTKKYEAELVGKFDNYSPPFKRFWKESEAEQAEESNVRGE